MTKTTAQNLVLDMDETLLHVLEVRNSEDAFAKYNLLKSVNGLKHRVYTVAGTDVLVPKGTGDVQVYLGVERPFLHEFLEYVRQRFNRVIIWSAGQKRYVEANIRHVTRFGFQPDAVFTADFCEGPLMTKPLEKLTKIFPDMNVNNTCLIDDRDTTFTLTTPKNGLLIPPYEPQLTHLLQGQENEDRTLLNIMQYMEESAWLTTQDVRTFDLMGFSYQGAKKLIHAPLNTRHPGDSLFDCLVTAHHNNQALTASTAEIIRHYYESNQTFRQLCDQRNLKFVCSTTVNALLLRLILVSTYKEYPELLDTHCEMAKSHSMNEWLSRYRPLNPSKRREIFRLMLDKDIYWGDHAALHVFVNLCKLEVRVLQGTSKQVLEPSSSEPALARICLRLTDENLYNFSEWSDNS